MSLTLSTLPKKLRKQLLAEASLLLRPTTSQPSSVVITEVKKKKTKRRNKRRNSPNQLSPSARNTPAQAYINTLNDPFTYGPERLGWATLVPTDIWTAYGRTTVAANADGTLAVMLFATVNGDGAGTQPLFYNNSGGAGTTWTAVDWNNRASLGGLFEQGRPVSLGLRIIPQIPATSAPATVFAGAIPCMAPAVAVTKSTNFFAGQPYLKMGYGCEGAVALGRPIGVESYTFTTGLYSQATNVEPSFSCPIILLQSLPASATCVFEYALNFESIRGLQSASAAIQESGASDDSGQATLVDSFPSIESMWKGIKSFVSDPGTVDNMARAAVQTARIGGMAYQAYNAMRTRASYFGNNSRGVMIEEVP